MTHNVVHLTDVDEGGAHAKDRQIRNSLILRVRSAKVSDLHF